MGNLNVIPQPKTFGPLGNLPLIDRDTPTLSFCKIADEYGPIFRFEAIGFSLIFISGHELVDEVCKDPRFDKSIAGALYNLRSLGNDGLFTSRTKEPNWKKAHNILLPSFSQQAMKGYHSMMVDIAMQLVQKWARLNPNESIDVPDDMTRLTLDTIGLCGFNYRFNSFYRENHNPFINSMVRALNEAMHQSTRLPIQHKLMIRTKKQFEQDIRTMFSLVDQIIADRKAIGDQGETDLLARMLNAKDPDTGEQLDDENIRFQIITFLIAGHETTSGLLSFALNLLLENPDVLKNAFEEVDRVLTAPVPTYEQVLDLKYIRMILNESLRLYPTAPQFALYAKEDVVLGGKYPIKKNETVAILLPQLHRDKEVWGEDAEQFRPERFEDPAKTPHHAFKPFGNGQRACIGMQFALHEATLVLGMILQHFELINHRNYQLKVKQTLTLKPDDFRLKVRIRENKAGNPTTVMDKAVETKRKIQKYTISGVNNRPLLVLYGSNMGTAERIARELAEAARSHGIESKAAPLDDRVGSLPKEGAVIIVTSSYNGKPPRNARKFVQWLNQIGERGLTGVRYAVLGCGDRNWANTYQEIPRLIDEKLASSGAIRFSIRGEAETSGEFEKQVEDWKMQLLQDACKTFGLSLNKRREEEGKELKVQFIHKSKDSFTPPQYEFVQNYVNRILRRFQFNVDEQVVLTAGGMGVSHLPLNYPVSIQELLSQYVNFEAAASREQIRELAAYTVCPPHKYEMEALAREGVYEKHIVENQVTMLDLLEKYEACEMPFERFLELLPPMNKLSRMTT